MYEYNKNFNECYDYIIRGVYMINFVCNFKDWVMDDYKF